MTRMEDIWSGHGGRDVLVGQFEVDCTSAGPDWDWSLQSDTVRPTMIATQQYFMVLPRNPN